MTKGAGNTTKLSRALMMDIAGVGQKAAIAAARLRGQGDEKAADQVAVDAMRSALNSLNISGTVVIGEGERDEAPMLYIGETVGTGEGPELDIALDPLEGTTICAKNTPNSLAVIAVAPKGGLLYAADVYMDKIAIGPDYPLGVVSLDKTPQQNILDLAAAKGVEPSEIMACVMDRPRHDDLIAAIRETGAGVRLIGDGDVAAVINTTDSEETGIDIYMGIGGAPEGVLAAAALRCVGGQMQGRLLFKTDEQRARAKAMGITDPDKIYQLEELAKDEVIFVATGVTDGNLLDGVKFSNDVIFTQTLIMHSGLGEVNVLTTKHKV